MKKSIKASIFCAVYVTITLLSLTTACAKDFTDEIGRSVTLKVFPPKRIISLSPNVTEILFELGLDQEIVGVTRECNYPSRAKEKPKVSEYVSINMELLVSLRPDLAIVSAEGNSKDQLTRMERLGITVYAVRTMSLSDIQDTIKDIASVTGRVEEGAKLAGSIKEKIAAIAGKLKGVKRKRVFCAVGVEPLVGAGPGTLIGDVIKAAGGENIIAPDAPDYPMMNLEELYVQDPDVILISSMGSEVVPNASGSYLKKFSKLTAYKNGKIFTVDADTLCRPSYRIVEALKDIAEKMHPERMAVEE